jgi:hypothetical protein
MVLNATFNNISALLAEETGGNGENHRPVGSHWQTLSHNVVHLGLFGIRTGNISGDSHSLHRQLQIQLPYDHDHDDALYKRMYTIVKYVGIFFILVMK